MNLLLYVENEVALEGIGNKLAQLCINNKGYVIYLNGVLGAGKTTLARGFIRGLGVTGRIKSPTYAIIESYEIGERSVYHFDLYRLSKPSDLNIIGINEYFREDTICLIEWPELGGNYLPAADLTCNLSIATDMDGRNIELQAGSSLGREIITGIQQK